jgi:hypothetical protein
MGDACVPTQNIGTRGSAGALLSHEVAAQWQDESKLLPDGPKRNFCG